MSEETKAAAEDFIEKMNRAPRWLVGILSSLITMMVMTMPMMMGSMWLQSRDNTLQLKGQQIQIEAILAERSETNRRLFNIENKVDRQGDRISLLMQRFGLPGLNEAEQGR